MDSSTNLLLQEEQKKAAIRRQIAQLQIQLGDAPQCVSVPKSPKRRKEHRNVLAPATPSPKKRKLNNGRPCKQERQKPLPSLSLPPSASLSKSSKHRESVPVPLPQSSSTVLTKLAKFAATNKAEESQHVMRSTSFLEKVPPVTGPGPEVEGESSGRKRDENLILVEDLELGAVEHNAPFDDPDFEKLEPNSGIRLSSRVLPHEDFQDYLRGRYYLSPSKLYSVVRLTSDKQGYDVPVDGDWVTIAVVAERGPLRYSRAPVGVGRDGQEHLSDKEDTLDDLSVDANNAKPSKPEFNKWKGKGKEQAPSKPTGKKYVNLKLIDFGCRSSGSSTSGKSVRGDAFLSLLLFESDRVDEAVDENGKKRKIYRGGSKGAFEKMSKLREGAVVAFMNPRILKPFQRSGDAPHPRDNILAITPESLDSAVVIGYSEDLGMCKAVKRDGKACGGWCDKRVSEVCEYHVQHAVERRRAGRAEFSIGTSGMSAAAAVKKKSVYDPSKQWGLKPENNFGESGGATYVVSGHVVSGGSSQSMFVGESVGRDAQAKAARQVSAKDADRALQRLLKRDKEGMKAVLVARDHIRKHSKPVPNCAKKDKKPVKGPSKGSSLETETEDEDSEINLDDALADDKKVKKGYSTNLIRSLGFDPASRDGSRPKDLDVQKKLDALAAVQAKRGQILLGPRPGRKHTTVRAPDRPVETEKTVANSPSTSRCTTPMPSLPSDNGTEETREEKDGEEVGEKMIDLDSSDVE